jgi:hypothetical protein
LTKSIILTKYFIIKNETNNIYSILYHYDDICQCGKADGGEECGTGDVNGDGINNVLDMVSIVNCVIGDGCEICVAVMNQDGILNILNVVLLVNSILN